MIIICEKDTLLKNLEYVIGATTTKSSLNILANFLLSAKSSSLEISATDLEISIKTVFPAQIEDEGEITLNAKKLIDIVRVFPDSCHITFELKEGNKVKLFAQEENIPLQFTIMGTGKEDFPEIPPFSGKNSFDLPQKVLKNMIKKVIFATAKEETRYILNGIFFEKKEEGKKLNLVATDGRRLSFITEEIDEIEKPDPFGMIVPIKVLRELERVLDKEGNCSISIDENRVYFKINDVEMSSNLLEGNFPNYNQVIPDSFSRQLIIPRLRFIESVDRISRVVDAKSHMIRINISENMIEITGSTADLADGFDRIDSEGGAQYTGEDIQMGFNYTFFREALDSIEENYVIMEVNENNTPVNLKGQDNDQYINIIMPMKL